MSKAELEIIKMKDKESSVWEQAKRKTLGTGAFDDIESDDEDYKPYDEGAEMSKLYRQILGEETNEDLGKSHHEVMRDVYGHTENKTDVLRNVLAAIYVKDPTAFTEQNEEVHKVLKNDYMIAWPQGYIPETHEVAKRPPKKTKEEIHLEKLKDKHSLVMAPLNKFYLDEAIQNLQKVCTTNNAITTYKTAGWKASFAKFKNTSIKE